MTPPPPFGTFPKIHPFWSGEASLKKDTLYDMCYTTTAIHMMPDYTVQWPSQDPVHATLLVHFQRRAFGIGYGSREDWRREGERSWKVTEFSSFVLLWQGLCQKI